MSNKDITYLKRIEKELRLLNEGLEDRVRQRTSELERANRELLDTLIRLQEGERVRETFVSALTHDLRTPLVAEQRALKLLQGQQCSQPQKMQGLLDRLVKNNENLLDMVNKLLEIYQYEAGKIQLRPTSIFLQALADEVCDTLSPLAESRHVDLHNHVPKDLEALEADADQLKRVLVNLLGNALQSLSEGGRIVIDAEVRGAWLEFRVQDNGPGISAEILPHLFDRYFAVEQTRKQIGSGLGLSICKMIAKLHGGDIRVDSTVGQGATFYVTLPVMQREA